jgi:hypothetical protein
VRFWHGQKNRMVLSLRSALDNTNIPLRIVRRFRHDLQK